MPVPGPRTEGVETTLDAFHRGAYHLVQPARDTHRSGVDATILAASVPGGFSVRLAVLGAGAGAGSVGWVLSIMFSECVVILGFSG